MAENDFLLQQYILRIYVSKNIEVVQNLVLVFRIFFNIVPRDL